MISYHQYATNFFSLRAGAGPYPDVVDKPRHVGYPLSYADHRCAAAQRRSIIMISYHQYGTNSYSYSYSYAYEFLCVCAIGFLIQPATRLRGDEAV